jgi:hypothetical protein
MFDTLLLRPSLKCNAPLPFTTLHPTTFLYTSLHFTLHYTYRHFTSSHLHFTAFSFSFTHLHFLSFYFVQERRKRVWLKYQIHTRVIYLQTLLRRDAVRSVNLSSFLQTTSQSVPSYSCRFLAPELIGQTHTMTQFSRKDYYHLQDTQ